MVAKTSNEEKIALQVNELADTISLFKDDIKKELNYKASYANLVEVRIIFDKRMAAVSRGFELLFQEIDQIKKALIALK